MAPSRVPAVAGLQTHAWVSQQTPTLNFPEVLTNNLVQLQSMVLQEHQSWQETLRILQAEREDKMKQVSLCEADKHPNEEHRVQHWSPAVSPRSVNLISCPPSSQDFTNVLPTRLEQHSLQLQAQEAREQQLADKGSQAADAPQAPAPWQNHLCSPPTEDCTVLPFQPETVPFQAQDNQQNMPQPAEDISPKITQAEHDSIGAAAAARLQHGVHHLTALRALTADSQEPDLARGGAPSRTLAIPVPMEECTSGLGSNQASPEKTAKKASFLLPGSSVAITAGNGDEDDDDDSGDNKPQKRVRLSAQCNPRSSYQDGSISMPQFWNTSPGNSIRGSYQWMAMTGTGSSDKRDSLDSERINCFDMHPCWVDCRPRAVMHTQQTVTASAKLQRDGTMSSTQAEKEFLDDDVLRDQDMRWSEFISRKIVITPGSAVRLTWDVCGFLLVFYDGITIPLMFFDPPQSLFVIVLQWLARFFWSIDIFISFITGYQTDDGRTETRLNKIAWHYMRTWFMVDAVIVVIDWMDSVTTEAQSAGAGGRMTKFMRIMRVLRTVRMLRVLRFLYMHSGEVTSKISLRIRSEEVMIIAGIVKLVTIVTGIIHIIACCWYGVGKAEGDWVDYYDLADASLGYRYACSFHWALTQFIGSADILPQNHRERAFAVGVLMVAFVTSGLVVSSITTLMTRLQIVTAHSSKQLTMLRRFLIENNISSELAGRVQRNAKHIIAEQKKNISECNVELLSMISTPLVVEIHFECHGSVLMWHPFFKAYQLLNSRAFRQICHVGVSRLRLSKGDVVISPGEVPQHPRMLYILSGELLYTRENHRPVRLEQQCWVCEPHLWIIGWIHHGELRAEADCAITALDAEQFHQTGYQFRSAEFFPARYAAVYVKKMNMSNDVSDLDNEAVDSREVARQAFPDSFFGRKKRTTRKSGVPPSLGFIGRVGTAMSRSLSRTTTLASLPGLARGMRRTMGSLRASVTSTVRASLRSTVRSPQ